MKSKNPKKNQKEPVGNNKKKDMNIYIPNLLNHYKKNIIPNPCFPQGIQHHDSNAFGPP